MLHQPSCTMSSIVDQPCDIFGLRSSTNCTVFGTYILEESGPLSNSNCDQKLPSKYILVTKNCLQNVFYFANLWKKCQKLQIRGTKFHAIF